MNPHPTTAILSVVADARYGDMKSPSRAVSLL